MSVSKLITLERVNGSGMVLAGDKEIARALYILRVNQTMIRSGQDDLPGEISISGHLLILDGEKGLPNIGPLTLVLEDGRKWEFVITSSNRSSGDYQVRISKREE